MTDDNSTKPHNVIPLHRECEGLSEQAQQECKRNKVVSDKVVEILREMFAGWHLPQERKDAT